MLRGGKGRGGGGGWQRRREDGGGEGRGRGAKDKALKPRLCGSGGAKGLGSRDQLKFGHVHLRARAKLQDREEVRQVVASTGLDTPLYWNALNALLLCLRNPRAPNLPNLKIL